MCRILSVSLSGCYRWRGRHESRRAIANRRLDANIQAIYAKSKGAMGSPKITDELNEMGFPVSKDRVALRWRPLAFARSFGRCHTKTPFTLNPIVNISPQQGEITGPNVLIEWQAPDAIAFDIYGGHTYPISKIASDISDTEYYYPMPEPDVKSGTSWPNTPAVKKSQVPMAGLAERGSKGSSMSMTTWITMISWFSRLLLVRGIAPV